MSLKLIFPKLGHEGAWEEILAEFRSNNEKPAPFGLYLKLAPGDFKEYIRLTEMFHRGVDLQDDFVPMSTYFLMEEDKADIIGAISIRQLLNAELFNINGNIGYGIRPLKRGQGYATKALGLALELCKERAMKRVLVTCNNDNYASGAVIRKNGGILENEFLEDNGNIVERYWIDL